MLVTVAAVSLLCPAAGAARAEPAPSGELRPAHISPELDDVVLTGAAYRDVVAATEQAKVTLAADEARLSAATERIGELTAERTRLIGLIDRDEQVKAEADRRIALLRMRLRHLALQAYVGADETAAEGAALSLDTAEFLEGRTSVTMRQAVTASTHERYLAQVDISTAAGDRLDTNRTALLQTTADLAATTDEAESARRAIEADRRALVASMERLRDTRATALVEGTDLPLVALDAYVHAARIAALRTPGCHLHWTLLAGIGKVESGQGTHGGAALRQDGTLTRPIVGVPLDGTNGNEMILESGGGYMRAQGPMQFLPSTWAAVAIDGDDDQHTDIQNLYDAAASAGAYLCRNGVDLRTDAGLRRAILTYNFSGEYVAKVLRATQFYAEALPRVPSG